MAVGVLLHIVTLVWRVKALFIAVRALYLATRPSDTLPPLADFPLIILVRLVISAVSLALVATNFSLLVVRDSIAVVSCYNTDLSLVAAAARLSK